MTQSEQILAYLKEGKTLTALDALNLFKCFRLASRINDLKKEGHDIKVLTIHTETKRYAGYYMESWTGAGKQLEIV